MTGFQLLVEERRDANGGAFVRKLLDDRFDQTGGWSKKVTGDVDWTKCQIVNGTRVCVGVELQISGRHNPTFGFKIDGVTWAELIRVLKQNGYDPIVFEHQANGTVSAYVVAIFVDQSLTGLRRMKVTSPRSDVNPHRS